MRENIVKDKSFRFASLIVSTYKELTEKRKEFVMSKQLLRSGTAVGALIREAEYAESKADFLHKMYIALKEANETLYWIDLLFESKFLSKEQYNTVFPLAEELLKLLVSITKTSKMRQNK